MTDRPLDPDPEEFRRAGTQFLEWIADYFRTIRERPVLSPLEPGAVTASLRPEPSESGKSFEELLGEFRSSILPGVTHWNHPRFFAYFSITGSQAGILGELLCAALNVNGMLWRTSPAATELETVTLGWLRDLLGLPKPWFGIINDTASINTFLALATAREGGGFDIRRRGMSGRDLPLFRVYCSDQAHSSVDKAALALGFGTKGIQRIASDESFRMNPDALRAAIESDRRDGVHPCAVVATIGTTSTAAVDPLEPIAEITAREGVWLHVDAAYGGAAALLDEFRYLWRGVESVDSLVVNPHKWLFTPIDCSVLYTRHPEALRQTFSLVPEYLQTSDAPEAVNTMDYGLQLGRRFRALKLWLVLEHYGVERLRETIRAHIDYARRLARELERIDGIELVAPQSMSVVVFRRVIRDSGGAIDENGSEAASVELLEQINASGECFVSHTRLRGVYAIRVAIGNGATVWPDIELLLDRIRQQLAA